MIWLVSVAGGVGALARFAADGWLQRYAKTSLPAGTLTINLIGSLLLGFLHGYEPAGTIWLALLGTGFCGGFTTFSTASVESVRLLHTAGIRQSISYAGATLVGCVALAGVGIWLGGTL